MGTIPAPREGGYKRHIRNILEVTRIISEGISSIEGLRLLAKPFLPIIGFTADGYDIAVVYEELRAKGWGCSLTKDSLTHEGFIRLSIHPYRNREYAEDFLEALEEAAHTARRKSR